MDRQLARRAHAILMKAVDIAPADRTRFIATACADDSDLHARVRKLVAAMDRSRGFLETPALASSATPSPSKEARRIEQIGPYRIVRVIGAGGMATVFEAVQERPRRHVALKVMRQGLERTSAIDRFTYESEILARLAHPGIAQIFEADTWTDPHGVVIPYFVMEFISDARTVTAYAHARSLSLAQRLQMFIAICDAVQHGHQNGVIHRDLKPANILVDSEGRTKVIDFGVARSTDPDQAWITRCTDIGQLIGTLNYMSPEQCEGAGAVDIRSDVYSLGVILYELLCGRLPHDFAGVPLPAALRVVREDLPPRPSTFAPELKGDLDAIILRAIDKDPGRRYRTAAALAGDISRFLNHQTIEARPPTLSYQCRLFARRNRALVTAVGVIAATIIAGAVLSASFGYQAMREAAKRQAAETRALEQRDEAIWRSYVADMAGAFAAYQSGELQQLRTRLASAAEQHRGWEWRFLSSCSERSLKSVAAHQDRVFDLAASDDGHLLASAGRDGVVNTWDAATLESRGRIQIPDASPAFAVAFDVGAGLILTGSEDGVVRLWDAGTAVLRQTIGEFESRVVRVAFGPDDYVAAAAEDGVGRIWNRSTNSLLLEFKDQPGGVTGLAYSRDRTRLLTWNLRGVVCLRTSDGAIARAMEFDAGIECGGFSPDGSLMAVGGGRGRVGVWDVETGRSVMDIVTPLNVSSVRALAFSPDAKAIAVGQIDRQVQILSVPQGARIEALRGHEEAVSGIRTSPDGRTLYTSSWDGTIRVWGLDADNRADYITMLDEHTDQVLGVAYSSDSSLLASACRDGFVRLWDAVLGELVCKLRGHGRDVASVSFSPDGKLLASASYDRTVRLWDVASASPAGVFEGHEDGVWTVAFHPDGLRLASGGDDKTIRIWRLNEDDPVHVLKGHTERVIEVAFSPDGRLLASASRDQSVRLWNVEDGTQVGQLDGHEADVFSVMFSADGRTLYSGSRDQTVRVWKVDTGKCTDVLAGHGQFVTGLALTRDGTRLAAGSWFGQIVLWDVATREIVASFVGQPDAIRAIAFSPNGRWLAAASQNNTVRIFDGSLPAERLAAHAAALADRKAAEPILGNLIEQGMAPDRLLASLEQQPGLDPGVARWCRLLLLQAAHDAAAAHPE